MNTATNSGKRRAPIAQFATSGALPAVQRFTLQGVTLPGASYWFLSKRVYKAVNFRMVRHGSKLVLSLVLKIACAFGLGLAVVLYIRL